MRRYGSVALIVVLVLAVIAIAAGAYYLFSNNVAHSGAPGNATSTEGSVFANQYITATIPAGWTVRQVGGSAAAVDITNGDYTLFIDARTAQASGIQGGRFGEITGNATSVAAVVTTQPSGPCGSFTTSTISVNGGTAEEYDMYVGPNDGNVTCAAPTNGNTVWYFSYITLDGGYFNYFQSPEFVGWVVTMSYDSKDINALPVRGSSGLNEALSQMDDILKTLTINPPVVYTPAVAGALASAPDTDWAPRNSEGLDSEGVPVVSCTDDAAAAANNTSTIDGADVQASYFMESLGGNSNNTSTMYTTGDATSVFAGVENILADAGWEKCNSVTVTRTVNKVFNGQWFTNAVDAYRFNNELADADLSSFLGVDGRVYWSINLVFFKLAND